MIQILHNICDYLRHEKKIFISLMLILYKKVERGEERKKEKTCLSKEEKYKMKKE